MPKIQRVVGIAFIKDGELLTCKSLRSSKRGKYTFIGGGVEEGETVLQAAVRECKEEIGNNFNITEDDFEPVMSFIEQAASDPNLLINMNIFLSKKQIDVDLIPNKEVLEFKWYHLNDDDKILSPSIKEHFIPWAIEKGIMYK